MKSFEIKTREITEMKKLFKTDVNSGWQERARVRAWWEWEQVCARECVCAWDQERERERKRDDFKTCAKKTGPKDSSDSFINSLCLTIGLIWCINSPRTGGRPHSSRSSSSPAAARFSSNVRIQKLTEIKITKENTVGATSRVILIKI